MEILYVRSQVYQETLYPPQNLLQLMVERSVDKNRQIHYGLMYQKIKHCNHITMKRVQNTEIKDIYVGEKW